MYMTVFRNRKRADMDVPAYQADNARMEELVAALPGFISIKGFVAEDGEVVAISLWESEEAAKAWANHPEHLRVQARGRSDYYESYTVFSCTDPRVRSYERPLA
ncbi:MAG: antibiotic biosynthesis monooxygenase [Sphingomonadales bacterium]|nr:antibiotic biosynthesis monooxygenase [Sphingomonadales bacterium]